MTPTVMNAAARPQLAPDKIALRAGAPYVVHDAGAIRDPGKPTIRGPSSKPGWIEFRGGERFDDLVTKIQKLTLS